MIIATSLAQKMDFSTENTAMLQLKSTVQVSSWRTKEHFIGGDLAKFIKKNGGKEVYMHTFIKIASDVCRALKLIHQNQLVHRDIRPENIFLTSKDKNSTGAKLGDFGMTRSKLSAQQDASVLESANIYLSPERISGKAVGTKADAWGVGAILFEMVTKQKQFKDLSMMPEFVDDKIKVLISRLLNEDPQ